MIDDKNICILLKCITTEIGKKKNALFSKYGITGFQSDILAFLYRNIDKETDVLSFPMFEKEEIEQVPDNQFDVLGDIVISIERVKEQAIEYGHSFERELSYMVVHGFYHLLGYDHMVEEDKIKMREKEENILNKLNIKR